MFVVARAVDQGRLAGIVSSLGLGLGNLVHVVGVVLGVSALLLSSATAYAALKYLGAAYLLYLGVQKLTGKDEPSAIKDAKSQSLRSLFYQGVVVNVLNPKVALFFLAFLPQFADLARGDLTVQLGVLGICFVLIGVVTDVFYALVAGTARQWLVHSKLFRRTQRYVTGLIYIGLATVTVVAGPQAR